MRQIAEEDDVAVVDLLGMSRRLLSAMNQQQTDEFDAQAHPDANAENGAARPDRTHLNGHGKRVFGRLIADNPIRTQVELGPNVNGVAQATAGKAPQQAAPTDGH